MHITTGLFDCINIIKNYSNIHGSRLAPGCLAPFRNVFYKDTNIQDDKGQFGRICDKFSLLFLLLMLREQVYCISPRSTLVAALGCKALARPQLSQRSLLQLIDLHFNVNQHCTSPTLRLLGQFEVTLTFPSQSQTSPQAKRHKPSLLITSLTNLTSLAFITR